jgi:hypothetical protein
VARTGDEEPAPDVLPGNVVVLLFCECMRRGEDGLASWRVRWGTGEYDVLSTEEVYAEVAGHRRVCQLQADLFAGSQQSGDEVRTSLAGAQRGGGAALHL